MRNRIRIRIRVKAKRGNRTRIKVKWVCNPGCENECGNSLISRFYGTSLPGLRWPKLEVPYTVPGKSSQIKLKYGGVTLAEKYLSVIEYMNPDDNYP
jgi:hypothetical protein